MGVFARPLPGAFGAAARQGVLSSAFAALALPAVSTNTGFSPLADRHRATRSAGGTEPRTQRSGVNGQRPGKGNCCTDGGAVFGRKREVFMNPAVPALDVSSAGRSWPLGRSL